jgi:hypothetical protein
LFGDSRVESARIDPLDLWDKRISFPDEDIKKLRGIDVSNATGDEGTCFKLFFGTWGNFGCRAPIK